RGARRARAPDRRAAFLPGPDAIADRRGDRDLADARLATAAACVADDAGANRRPAWRFPMSARVVGLSFPAHSRYLVLARLSIAGIAPVARLPEDVLADLKLAVTEACANAVRHAYQEDEEGAVRLRLALDDSALTIEVADDGRGIGSAATRSHSVSSL